jgi:hypothetical protein
MAQTPDYFTQMLPGQMVFILGAAALLVFPISFLLLRLYRHAVLKSMDRRTGAAEDLPRVEEAPAAPSFKPAASLRIITLQETDDILLTPEARAYYDQAIGAPWRAAAVYSIGGAIFAASMTIAWFVSTKTQISPLRFLSNFWIFGWPLLLTLALIVGARVRTRLLLVPAYFCIYAILGIVALALSPKLSFTQLFVLWIIPNAPPTAMVLAYLARRVRAVGPLVFTVLFMAATGAIFSSQIIGSYNFVFRKIVSLPLNFSFDNQIFTGLYLHGSVVFSVIEWPLLREVMEGLFSLALGVTTYARFFTLRHLLGFAVFGALGWLLAQWIRARYERKKISDQSLTLDSLWLLFGIVYSTMLLLADRGPQWALACIVAFLAYKIAVAVGFAVAKDPGGGQGVRLLLLACSP